MENFTIIKDELSSNKMLSSSDKMIISHIISWQKLGKICYVSNAYLSERFGLSLSGVEKILSKLMKYNWYTKINNTHQKADSWYNEKTLKINEEILSLWLDENKIIKKELKVKKAKIEPLLQVEEIVPVIEEKQLNEVIIEEPIQVIEDEIDFIDTITELPEPIAPQINKETEQNLSKKDMKKQDFKEKFIKKMRFAGHLNMEIPNFLSLTNNYFDDMDRTILYKELNSIQTQDDIFPMLDRLMKIKEEQNNLVESNS